MIITTYYWHTHSYDYYYYFYCFFRFAITCPKLFQAFFGKPQSIAPKCGRTIAVWVCARKYFIDTLQRFWPNVKCLCVRAHKLSEIRLFCFFQQIYFDVKSFHNKWRWVPTLLLPQNTIIVKNNHKRRKRIITITENWRLLGDVEANTFQ